MDCKLARKQGPLCKALVEWILWGEKRPRGRPYMRWYDDITGLMVTKWLETAQGLNLEIDNG